VLCVRGDGSVCLFWKMLCVLSELKCLGSPVLLVRMDDGVSERGGQCNGVVVGMVCECMVPLVGQL
jgi:hypothetical protein